MNKRGIEYLSILIGLLVLIASALIVYFFIIRVNLQDTASDQACSSSVTLRATAPESANTLVSLSCQTKKLCFSEDGKMCPDFEGESNVKVIKIPPKEHQKSADIIEQNLAENMLQCWKNLGEGKLDLFSGGWKTTYGIKTNGVTCFVCNRVAFNINPIDRDEIFKATNLKEYLRKTPVEPGGDTYLKTFTDKTVSSYPVASQNDVYTQLMTDPNVKKETIGNTQQLVILFSQIQAQDTDSLLSRLSNVGTVAAVGAAFLAPVIIPIATAVSVPALIVTVGIAGSAAAGVTVYSISSIWAGQSAAAGYCGQFTSNKAQAEKGCSTIQVMPYDANALNSICTNGYEGLQ
jgi:hypothetical protein